MKNKFIFLLIVFVIGGCAQVRKDVTTLIGEDTKNIELMRTVAMELAGSWSGRSLFIRIVFADILKNKTVKAMDRMDELAKKTVKSNDDYAEFMGWLVVVGRNIGRELLLEIVPEVLTVVPFLFPQ